MRRSQRIAAITKMLVDKPHHIFSLADFTEPFAAAKSTISEDLAVIREAFADLDMGRIETLPGAAGGVRYVPKLAEKEMLRRIAAYCGKLSEPGRILPGGFIYLNDLCADPQIVTEIGEIFADRFWQPQPQYVITVETSGIPMALMTARYLNIPLLVVRRGTHVSEGSVLTVNYVSGSTRRIQTMSLARRALPEGSRVLIIDDFMRAGGTLRGLIDLMVEFECEVVGMGVFIETVEPQMKLVSDYLSLIQVNLVETPQPAVNAQPSSRLLELSAHS